VSSPGSLRRTDPHSCSHTFGPLVGPESAGSEPAASDLPSGASEKDSIFAVAGVARVAGKALFQESLAAFGPREADPLVEQRRAEDVEVSGIERMLVAESLARDVAACPSIRQPLERALVEAGRSKQLIDDGFSPLQSRGPSLRG